MDGFLKALTAAARGFARLTPSRQIAFVAVVIASVVSITLLFHFMNRVDYVVLYSDLTAEDAGTIAMKLQEKNVPYRVSLSGDRVMVPSDRVSAVRIELASSGLPLGGGVGFEIFDEKNFGVTEFVQKLNYQRALQGELARTVSGLDEIVGSRVHIVLPEKSIFAETRQKPTASVALRMKSGRRLDSSQVEGIVNLVARSVEGLNPDDVMVVDNSGVILSQSRSRSDVAVMTGSQLEYQRAIEGELAERVQAMLERIVGRGNAVATVSARLDFEKIQKTEEFFDPDDPVVRSTHRKTERSLNHRGAEESTVDPTEQGMQPARADRERMDEVIHYELSRTVSTRVKPLGGIEQLSVAVLVDGSYRRNEQGEEVYEPRSARELTQLDDLVKKAVGFDQRRGDQVVITNIPFKRADLSIDDFADAGTWVDAFQTAMPVVKAVMIMVAVLAVVLFVLRPMGRVLVQAGRTGRPDVPALAGERSGAMVSDFERQREQTASALNMEAMDTTESEEIALVKSMARQDAGTFTELLRSWLK